MKKILLTALVAVSALAANAQVWVGGSLGFGVHNYKDAHKATVFELSPEIGYALDDKIDLAIAFNTNFGSYKPNGGESVSTNEWTINPYVRYTFYQTGAVGFFVDGMFKVGSTNRACTDEGVVSEGDAGMRAKTPKNTTVWGIGIRPGVKFAASDKVTFVATCGFLGYRHLANDNDKVNDFGLSVDGSALKFGLYYSF